MSLAFAGLLASISLAAFDDHVTPDDDFYWVETYVDELATKSLATAPERDPGAFHSSSVGTWTQVHSATEELTPSMYNHVIASFWNTVLTHCPWAKGFFNPNNHHGQQIEATNIHQPINVRVWVPTSLRNGAQAITLQIYGDNRIRFSGNVSLCATRHWKTAGYPNANYDYDWVQASSSNLGGSPLSFKNDQGSVSANPDQSAYDDDGFPSDVTLTLDEDGWYRGSFSWTRSVMSTDCWAETCLGTNVMPWPDSGTMSMTDKLDLYADHYIVLVP